MGNPLLRPFLVPVAPQETSDGLGNLALYQKLNELARLEGITSEQALRLALTDWIEKQLGRPYGRAD